MKDESELQCQVADYLCLQYPDVLFHSDFGSGVKLTPGQAVKQKRQNGGRRGWPDIVIAKMKVLSGFFEHELWAIPFSSKHPVKIVGGLYIELKKEGTKLTKKNGEWKNEHIAEQAKVIEDLRKNGYCAEFAIGFDEAKRIIDEYLGGK